MPMADSWSAISKFFAKMKSLDGDTIELSKDDFTLLLALAEDGSLVHHKNLTKIYQKIFTTEIMGEFDKDDTINDFVAGIMGVTIDLAKQANVTERRLGIEEYVRKGYGPQ